MKKNKLKSVKYSEVLEYCLKLKRINRVKLVQAIVKNLSKPDIR